MNFPIIVLTAIECLFQDTYSNSNKRCGRARHHCAHTAVLENARIVIFFYQINQLKGLLLDSLIGWFPAGSKIYSFCRLLKSDKLPLGHLLRRNIINWAHSTNEHMANILTKSIDDFTIFGYLRWKICRWWSMPRPITR